MSSALSALYLPSLPFCLDLRLQLYDLIRLYSLPPVRVATPVPLRETFFFRIVCVSVSVFYNFGCRCTLTSLEIRTKSGLSGSSWQVREANWDSYAPGLTERMLYLEAQLGVM